MKTGKVSNSVLKRSVLKLIRHKNQQVEAKPLIGSDCAQINVLDNHTVLASVSCGVWPVYQASNNIAACGGVPVAAECSILLPEDCEEHELKSIMKDLDEQCEALDMQISGGHTQVSASVSKPVVSVTGIGMKDRKSTVSYSEMKPDQDIIMTKWIGIGGIRKVIDLKQEEILKLYTREVMDRAAGTQADVSVLKEARIAAENGAAVMHDASEGGIYAALWDMAEAGKVGMDIDFTKIAVRQEMIEICEIFDINPYELESSGCLLMTSEKGCDMIKVLSANGIPACIIGRTTSDHAKIIRNREEVRYLDTPNRDELYRFL